MVETDEPSPAKPALSFRLFLVPASRCEGKVPAKPGDSPTSAAKPLGTFLQLQARTRSMQTYSVSCRTGCFRISFRAPPALPVWWDELSPAKP